MSADEAHDSIPVARSRGRDTTAVIARPHSMGWFTKWRRQRILRRSRLDERLWGAVVERLAFTRCLPPADRARLRDWAVLFLDRKSIVAAGGLDLTEEMRVSIAVQACMLILNLDLDYYRDWVEVIVYPGEFIAEYEYMDEFGVAHRVEEPMSGESWLAGPVILSWEDTALRGGEHGYNVVIHEFAHKLDMLNGDANGFPPLHAGMDRAAWSGAFGEAYEDFKGRVQRREPVSIDPYAAETPAEFFAVLSEAFFEIPDKVRAAYPRVYEQLAAFYRQDPAARATVSRPASDDGAAL